MRVRSYDCKYVRNGVTGDTWYHTSYTIPSTWDLSKTMVLPQGNWFITYTDDDGNESVWDPGFTWRYWYIDTDNYQVVVYGDKPGTSYGNQYQLYAPGFWMIELD